MEKPKILVVEDEPAIAETIRYALETDGCSVHWLTTGAPVPELITEARVDLIVLYIGLPDISGMELCKEIRKTSTIPIIFLTARADEVDRVVGLEIGGDDYMVKPFSPRELSARVKAVLRRTRIDPVPLSERPQHKKLVIDPDKRQICYEGVRLELSRYEYNILIVFIKKPGRVFSRDQLMEHAWEEPDASMDRTVDAHIKNLRAKMRRINPAVDPIVTHRGVGYALREGL